MAAVATVIDDDEDNYVNEQRRQYAERYEQHREQQQQREPNQLYSLSRMDQRLESTSSIPNAYKHSLATTVTTTTTTNTTTNTSPLSTSKHASSVSFSQPQMATGLAGDSSNNKPDKKSTASKMKNKSSNILFGVIRQAKDDADNPIACVTNLYSGVCNSICSLVAMFMLTAVPLASIVIGSLYKNKCPIQSKIPEWLIVAGVFGILYSILRLSIGISIIVRKRKQKTDSKYEPYYMTCIVFTFSLFLFIWFIVGSVWVYSIYSQVDTTTKNMDSSSTYCHPTCYYFAFWSIAAFWIMLFLILLIIICIVAFFGISFLAPRLFHS